VVGGTPSTSHFSEDDGALLTVELFVNRTLEQACFCSCMLTLVLPPRWPATIVLLFVQAAQARQYGVDGLMGLHWRTMEVCAVMV